MIILAFSLIITAAFVGVLIVFLGGFQRSGSLKAVASTAYNTNTYALTLSAKDTEQLFVEGSLILTPGNVVSIETYNESYLNFLMSRILPYAVCFCVLLFALSVGLWLILRRIQTKNGMRIVKQLNGIQEMGDFSDDDPALIQAYENLKQKFDDNLNQYRLNYCTTMICPSPRVRYR